MSTKRKASISIKYRMDNTDVNILGLRQIVGLFVYRAMGGLLVG